MTKPLLGVFQIEESKKYEIEAILNEFNEERPFKYRLSFSSLYRALVDRFLEDLDFRSDFLKMIAETQIPIPVLECPNCNSTKFSSYDPPYVYQCKKCNTVFSKSQEYMVYMESVKQLDIAKSKVGAKLTDFEEFKEIKCIQCGASESDLEIPEITDRGREIKRAVSTCKKCGRLENVFGLLVERELLKNAKLRGRQRVRLLEEEDLKKEEDRGSE